MYNTCPDFPEIIWKVTSVVLAFIAVFGIVSNLVIVAAFIRNNSVSLQNQLLSKMLRACTELNTSGKTNKDIDVWA